MLLVKTSHVAYVRIAPKHSRCSPVHETCATLRTRLLTQCVQNVGRTNILLRNFGLLSHELYHQSACYCSDSLLPNKSSSNKTPTTTITITTLCIEQASL